MTTDGLIFGPEGIIRQALRNSKGSVTRTGGLLGISYRLLTYLLEHRHRDLLIERNPAKPRARSILKKY